MPLTLTVKHMCGFNMTAALILTALLSLVVLCWHRDALISILTDVCQRVKSTFSDGVMQL